MRDVKERLMEKVEPDLNSGCWLWSASLNNMGYGQFGMGRKVYLAHRISYQIFKGNPGSLFVLHKCDVSQCVNPNHLFLGTQADNLADRDAKGRDRTPKGEATGSARLKEKDVLFIRNVCSKGKFGTQA